MRQMMVLALLGLCVAFTPVETNAQDAERARLAKIAGDATGRKEFAKRIETAFLKDGRDATVTVSGPKNIVLTMKYVLINRPFIYKMANESQYLENARDAGFKTAIFTDGYTGQWTYDLSKLGPPR